MKNALFLFIILFILTGFVMKNNQQEWTPSKGEQLVNSILARTAKIIKDKYNLKPCGAGAAMPGGPIQGLTLCFDTKYPCTKEQLREVLIKSAHALLKQVNDDNDIQEFIKKTPFTLYNVDIIIYNNDKDGRDVYDPQISTARFSQGILSYSTTDKNDPFKYKNEFEETYEEALREIKE